jgi:hypothetical protein
MPQTFLALGALFLIGLVILHQHRGEVHEQQRAIRSEIEEAARTVGTEVFEHLATLRFDAAGAVSDSTALTPEALFGLPLSSHPLADATDVDDVHGMRGVEVWRTLTDPQNGTVHFIAFTLNADVGYVMRIDTALVRTGGAPTFAKEVVLAVHHPQALAPLQFRRVYTP